MITSGNVSEFELFCRVLWNEYFVIVTSYCVKVTINIQVWNKTILVEKEPSKALDKITPPYTKERKNEIKNQKMPLYLPTQMSL